MLRWIRLSLLCAILLAGGCAGQSRLVATPTPTDLMAALPSLESMPQPHQAAALSNYTFAAADLVSTDGGQLLGTTLDLPAAGISWAVVGASFPGNTAINATLTGTCSNLYVLASDYSQSRWKLAAGPLSAAGSFALPAGIMRGDNSTFLALLCPAGGSFNGTVSVELTDQPIGQPLSGTVKTEVDFPLENVTLTLTGAGNFQTTSIANGTYTFPAVPAGDYTLTATLTDCAFTPAALPITMTAAALNGQDFTATLSMPDITPYAFRLDAGPPDGLSVLRVVKGTNIDVFVEDGAGVPGWDPSFNTGFKEAILNWNALSDPWGLFHIRNTDTEANAEIVVSWRQTFNNGGQVGVANVSFFSDHTIALPYTIEMATENSDGPVDVGVVRKAGVHEVGHCLGLWDHSTDPTDIMNASVSTFEIPSRRDLLTVYTLFNTLATFTTGGRSPSQAKDLERRTISVE